MPDATERKVLVITTFIAGCLALAPQEWVSAGALFITAALLFFLNHRIDRAEDALLRLLDRWVPPPPPSPTTAPAEPSAPAAADGDAEQEVEAA